jgi:hypothetical protein
MGIEAKPLSRPSVRAPYGWVAHTMTAIFGLKGRKEPSPG